jgi:glycosyltransferase involved in cell wall biosynthesis
LFKIAAIIKKHSYELICIQRGHDIVQSWLAALLSSANPLLIHTVHIADFVKSHFLFRRLHGVVAISRYIYEKIIAFYPALANRVAIIQNGINLTVFARNKVRRGFIRDRFGLSTDAPLLSTVGVMWKNQIAFLDALVIIKQKIPDIRYLLLTSLNSIPEIQVFKDRAAELGLTGSLLWLDSLPKEAMPSYYADIDVAVSTFPNEGFGLWVIEALAMGTPVVSVDEGGVRDALEGCPAARLVQAGAQEMAVEVIRILTDRTVRRQMSEAGPQWVAERFSRERMIEEYYRYFDAQIKN